MTTKYRGIDYGRRKTNIDETGIRFGVIPHGSVGSFWYEDSEAIYPEADEYMSEEDLEFAEPIGFKFEDEDYFIHQTTDDPDIWIERSPYFTYAQFCSPCAPGAVYLLNELDTTDGPLEDNRGYCLGPEWFEDGVTPYTVYRVSDGSIVPPPVKTEEELLEKIEKWAEENKTEVYWDQGSELSKEQVQKLLKNPTDGINELYEELWEMNLDYIWELESELLKNLKDEMAGDLQRIFPDENLRDEFLDDQARSLMIVDLGIDKLIKHVPDIVIVLSLYSNYDCAISSDKIEDGENYLSDIWERVKDGINRKAFEAEFANAYTASLLCFAVKMSFEEASVLLSEAKTADTVKVPKGTQFGFFSSWNGSGSMWSSATTQDLEFKQLQYDGWGVEADLNIHYSLADVYGGTNFIESGQFIVWNQKAIEKENKMKKLFRICQALSERASEKNLPELLWGTLADDPEKAVVIANWNNTPASWQPLFERLEAETWFDDEYAICDDCGGFMHTRPGFYGDELRFITTDHEILCQECIEEKCTDEESLEDVFADFIYTFHTGVSALPKAIPSWMTEMFAKYGWNCWSEGDDAYCKRYETGFHPGQNDSPEKEAKAVWEADSDLRVVFAIKGIGQFDIHWTILVKPAPINEEDYDDNNLPKFIVDEAQRLFTEAQAADDFCIQAANWPEWVTFGGTNRVIWRKGSGFALDKSACTSGFQERWEKICPKK